MSLKNRFSHAASVTKWKADQQMRILKTQGRINELEAQIKAQKAVLADAALAAYAQGNLAVPELLQICGVIEQIYAQVQVTQQELEAIRQEQPPALEPFSADVPTSQPGYGPAPAYTPPPAGYTPAPTTPSGLICPACGQPLTGKFCPVHGLAGIVPPAEDETPVE
ncbi:MAG TPA: hypothetical protein GYA06_06595 [Chloroflexi bacterium]|nr:hypothetical protein [Chloroflexota bacterium]